MRYLKGIRSTGYIIVNLVHKSEYFHIINHGDSTYLALSRNVFLIIHVFVMLLILLRIRLIKKMPIKPENRHLYPENWPEIRERIRARAGDKCEECGVKNHAIGARDEDGGWWDKEAIGSLHEMLFDEFPKMIMIVCTVAHLDHNPENCEDENLRFWCQRCHNRYDAPHRAETRRRNRNKNQIELPI